MTQNTARPSTHDAIMDAAIAVLAENEGASISEIALRAGVGRATLHRHFRTRQDLLIAIANQSIDETHKAVNAHLKEGMTALEQLEAMFHAVIPLGDRYHFLYRANFNDEQSRSKFQQDLDWFSSLVTALKREQVLAQDIPNTWAVAQIDQIAWVAWREVGEGRLAPIDASALALRTFLKGLGP